MSSASHKHDIFGFLNYTPNPSQAVIHDDESRIRLVAGGERAGKSYTGAQELVAQLVEAWAAGKTGLKYWIVGPDYEQANKAEFIYVYDALKKLDAGKGVIKKVSIPREGSRSLELFDGSEIQTKTSEDFMKLASVAVDGVLMVEAAQQTWEVFQRLMNRTAERRGWVWLSGTFETSRGWFAEMWNTLQVTNKYGGKSFSLPSWSNLNIYPGGEEDPEIINLKQTNPADMFQERFGGIPVPPRTIVYPEFRVMRHARAIRFGDIELAYPIEDERGWIIPGASRVQLWIDPGWRGAYAVLFAVVVGPTVFVVDEIYHQGRTAEQVIYTCQNKRDLWPLVRGGVIDIAGTQHQGMESHVEIWQRLAKVSLRSSPVPIVDGIHITRRFLADPLTGYPRIYIDPKCEKTIKEFGLYKYRETTEFRNESELPIDRDNHSMKAIAYGLYDNFRFVDRLERKRPRAYLPPGTFSA